MLKLPYLFLYFHFDRWKKYIVQMRLISQQKNFLISVELSNHLCVCTCVLFFFVFPSSGFIFCNAVTLRFAYKLLAITHGSPKLRSYVLVTHCLVISAFCHAPWYAFFAFVSSFLPPFWMSNGSCNFFIFVPATIFHVSWNQRNAFNIFAMR